MSLQLCCLPQSRASTHIHILTQFKTDPTSDIDIHVDGFVLEANRPKLQTLFKPVDFNQAKKCKDAAVFQKAYT